VLYYILLYLSKLFFVELDVLIPFFARNVLCYLFQGAADFILSQLSLRLALYLLRILCNLLSLLTIYLHRNRISFQSPLCLFSASIFLEFCQLIVFSTKSFQSLVLVTVPVTGCLVVAYISRLASCLPICNA